MKMNMRNLDRKRNYVKVVDHERKHTFFFFDKTDAKDAETALYSARMLENIIKLDVPDVIESDRCKNNGGQLMSVFTRKVAGGVFDNVPLIGEPLTPVLTANHWKKDE